MVKVFVTGCLHAEWDLLVNTVNALAEDGTKIDFILVTGDCETFRNEEDMKSFTAPLKYHKLGTFYKIYNGETRLPCPAIIIGGNHEASDLLHQLPFGGWIAPNVFYIGRACQLIVGDVLISGISGLYKTENYYTKVNETFPLRTVGDMHTAYAFRAFSDFQLFGLKSTQIMLSHDWPSQIPSKFGGKYMMNRRKDLVEADKQNTFGLPMGMKLIEAIKPSTWFASHHHINFHAQINKDTSFIALPKPTRSDWFIVADVDGKMGPIKYTGQWISILKATGKYMEDPSLLKCDWKQLWNEIGPIPESEPIDPEPYNADPVKITIDFCQKHGVYCPNDEIRQLMNA